MRRDLELLAERLGDPRPHPDEHLAGEDDDGRGPEELLAGDDDRVVPLPEDADPSGGETPTDAGDPDDEPDAVPDAASEPRG
jgi:hypothetical protein